MSDFRRFAIALLSCILGALALPETKDNDLTAG